MKILPKEPLKNRNQTPPLERYFPWKLELVPNTLWMIVPGNLFVILTRPGPFKLNLLDNFENSKAFHTALTYK